MPNVDESNNTGDNNFLTDMTDDEHKNWLTGVVGRMITAWQLENKKSLATKLGIHEKTPSNWIQRRITPYEFIFSCHIETGRSLHWLYFGEDDAVKITPTMHRSFIIDTTALLQSAETMEMLKILDDSACSFFVKGLVKSFLRITKTKVVDE
jgi:hypothetical protein